MLTANAAFERFGALEDSYHKRIFLAAKTLVIRGLGASLYQTQWSSGSTAWMFGGTAISMNPDGTPVDPDNYVWRRKESMMELSDALESAVKHANEHNKTVFVLQEGKSFYILTSMHMQAELKRHCAAVVHPQLPDVDGLKETIARLEQNNQHLRDTNQTFANRCNSLQDEIANRAEHQEKQNERIEELEDDKRSLDNRLDALIQYLQSEDTDLTWGGTEYKCFDEDELAKAIELAQQSGE